MSVEYRPLRVLRNLTVMAASLQELTKLYPHAKHERMSVGSKGEHTGTVAGIYSPKQFIDFPTPAEREILTVKLGDKPPAAVEIPQHKDGYDLPTSGVARSREGSFKGQQAVEVVKAKAKIEEAKVEKPITKVDDPKKDGAKKPRAIKKSASEKSVSEDKTDSARSSDKTIESAENSTTGGDK